MLVPRNYDRKGVDLKSVTGWTLSSVGVIALGIGGAQLIQGLSEGNDAAVAARNAECYDDCADTFFGHQESYESAFQDTRIGTAVSSVGAALLGTGISLLVIF